MSITSQNTTPAAPETKAGLPERVDTAVEKAQVRLDTAIDAAQHKAKAAGDEAAAKAAEAREKAKERAVDVLDATQSAVEHAVGKAKDALQK
jgi:hypothetical protein